MTDNPKNRVELKKVLLKEYFPEIELGYQVDSYSFLLINKVKRRFWQPWFGLNPRNEYSLLVEGQGKHLTKEITFTDFLLIRHALFSFFTTIDFLFDEKINNKFSGFRHETTLEEERFIFF